MKEKAFRLSADEIQPLVEGLGACFATDAITVDGLPVGFMYREEPEFDADSGWRFLSGTETQEYIDDPENLAIYDVNTIANYDPDIIPLLGLPAGTALERASGEKRFVPVELEDEPE